MKKSVSLFVSILLIAVFALPSGGHTQTSGKAIKLATLSTLQPFMAVVKDELVKKGYAVELVLFDANNMPAIATKDGDIDGFIHNHLPWIETFNKEKKSNLEMLEPYFFYYRMALYSKKHNSLAELPDGAVIAIPNDPANLQTTLLFFQRLGLLTLGEKVDTFYSILDIKENPKNIKLIETEISTTARSLTDADAVVCPAVRVMAAGIDPKSFLAEDETTKKFPVGLTIDSKNAKEAWVKDTMKILKSDVIKTSFNDRYKGSLVLFN
ncbi:MAG: D-methionine transport system substrate-binding protein [Desulforhopalus sp.]|jgi:D-methionine transport system substrate-binding protein